VVTPAGSVDGKRVVSVNVGTPRADRVPEAQGGEAVEPALRERIEVREIGGRDLEKSVRIAAAPAFERAALQFHDRSGVLQRGRGHRALLYRRKSGVKQKRRPGPPESCSTRRSVSMGEHRSGNLRQR
jgi:hypothetical protein